jgi:hypothetical protein
MFDRTSHFLAGRWAESGSGRTIEVVRKQSGPGRERSVERLQSFLMIKSAALAAGDDPDGAS